MANPKYRTLTKDDKTTVVQRYFPWLKWVTFTEWYTIKTPRFGSEQSADAYIAQNLS